MESNINNHNQDHKETDSNIGNNNYGEREDLNEQYNKDTAMFIKNQDSGNIIVENQSYNNTETREFYNNNSKNIHSLHSDSKQDNEININDNKDNCNSNENNDNMKNTSISKAKSNNSFNEPLFIMNLELENQNVELKIFRDSIPEQLAYEFCNKHALDFDSMSYLKAEIDELLYKYNINQKTSSSAVVEDNEINDNDEAKNSNINNINNQNAGYNNNFENHENSSTRKSYGNTKKSEFHIIYEEDKEEALGKGDTKDIEHDKSQDKNYDVFNKFNLNNDNSNRNIINSSNNSNKMNTNSNSRIHYNENLPNNSINQYDNSKNPYRNKPINNNHNIEDSNHSNNHSNNVYDDHDANEEFIYNNKNQTNNNNEEHSHIIGISQASNFNNMNDPSIFNQDTNRVDISKTDSRNNNNNNNYSKNNRELDESIGVRLSQDSVNNDDNGNQDKNNQEQNINLSTLNTNPNNSKINLNINKNIDNNSNSNNNNKKEYAYTKSKSKPKYFSNQITSDIVPRKNKSMSKYNNSNYSNTASNFNKYNFFKNNEVNNISKTKNTAMYTNRNLSNEKLYNSSKRLWNQDVFTHLYEDAKSKKMKKLIAENNKIQEENNNFLNNLNEFKNNFPLTKISEKCQDTGEDLYLRGKKNKDKVSRKLHLMKNKASDKQYEECSFTPQINKQGVFRHVQSKNVQSLDYKEFQNNRNSMLNKIKENIQSDEEENTFKPIINNKKKYENMKPLVYDIKDTYIKKIKAEERVLNEKAKKEYYRPIVSSSKNDKILSTSRLYGKTNNVSDLRNTNSYSVNSNEIDNNNCYYGISNNDGELAGMLNYNKKNKDNDNNNDDNILIKDNLNNNNDFNNRTKRVIKFSTNSENQEASISRPKYNNTSNKSTNISTTNSKHVNTNTNINTKTYNNNNTNTNTNKNSNYYISPSFDARQELYKELHEKKISSLQKDREREERMKSESITIIINKHHSQHNIKKENYNTKNQESQDCINNINNNTNNTQENQLKFSSDDIFTKNYEYANIYKSKKEKLSKSSQEKFLITCNKQKSDNNSVRLCQEKLNQQFKKLFSVLDFDHDDLITKRSVGVKRLSKKLAEIVSPLIKELIEEDETLNCEEFIQAMSHLNNCLNYFEKNELIKEIEAIKETSNYISYREFNYYNNSGNYNENKGDEFYNNSNFDNKSHHNKVGFYSDQHSKTINNFNINYNISSLNNYNNNSNNNTSNILLNTPYKQNSEMNIHMNQTLTGLNSGRSSHNISKINNTNNNNHTSSKKNTPYSSSIFNIKKNNFSNMNNALSRINSSSNNVVNKKNRYDPYSDMTFKPKINSNSRRIDSQKTYGLV